MMVATHWEILRTRRVVWRETDVSPGCVSEVYTETYSRILPVLAVRALVLVVVSAFRNSSAQPSAVGYVMRESGIERRMWYGWWVSWRCWS